MKRFYIVVDLATRKVAYESHNLQGAENYINNNGTKALYLITLTLDAEYPCVRGLDGCAY